MAKPNPKNERIKRAYFHYLREAKGRNQASIDAVAKALTQYEDSTSSRDFGALHQKAVAFKRRLSEHPNARTGERLSRATVHSTLQALRAFFVWLAGQPGYKSKLSYSDADYFNLSEKDARIAKATREKPFPTLEQIHRVLDAMPHGTDIERRDRALIAFTLLTGARDGALASLKLKHVDLAQGRLDQDAREVNTKSSKTFATWFYPVGGAALEIVADWINHLRINLLWGEHDPLFPKTLIGAGPGGGFIAAGLTREHWSNADAIRRIFREAFEAAGMPVFKPHSFRDTLVQLGERICKSPEEFKAWSQNLGHSQVLTTFTSYGAVATHRQAELIRQLGAAPAGDGSDTPASLIAKLSAMIAGGANATIPPP